MKRMRHRRWRRWMRLQVYWVVRPEHAQVEGALLRWRQVLLRRRERIAHRTDDVLLHCVEVRRGALTLPLSVLPQLISNQKSKPNRKF